MMRMSMPMQTYFIADHSFMFYLEYKTNSENHIMFVGRLAKPSQ